MALGRKQKTEAKLERASAGLNTSLSVLASTRRQGGSRDSANIPIQERGCLVP
jgi:hypothetical protein